MKLKIVSFTAEHFNNNGDQGNLEVIKFALDSIGVDYDEQGPSQISSADFVLVGDASRAAIRFYQPGLEALVPALAERLKNGAPTLLVGSSYEFLAPLLGLGEPQIVERVSDFACVDYAGGQVVGYQNSDTDLPVFQITGCFVATKLFGPVLAKNPELLSIILAGVGVKFEVPAEMSSEINQIRSKIIS